MGRLLDPHELRLAQIVIPAPRLLLQRSAAAQDLALALDLISQRATNAADRIEILQLDLGAPLFRADRTHRHIDITPHLTFFHVGVGDIGILQMLFERGQISEGLFGIGDVGLGHDLHERCAGAVEIDAGGVLQMETFGHVFLEMDPGQADDLILGRDALLRVFRISQIVQRHAAAETKRHVVLRDLVVLRHVRVVVALAVELADLRNFASEHETREDG